MGRRKRKNRNRRRRERRRGVEQSLQIAPGKKRKRLRMSLSMGPLDVARGHDGLLRGHPEPVVIVAAFDCRPDKTTLITRHRFRYVMKEPAPVWLEADDQKQLRRPRLDPHDGTVVILVVAIEEDRGRDISDLYAALNATDDVVVWRLDGSVAEPCSLDGVRNLSLPREPTRLGLRISDGPPIDAFRNDDYVGTSAVWLPLERTPLLDLAFPIASKDSKNEWTPHLSVQLR